jgi:plastocyanin
MRTRTAVARTAALAAFCAAAAIGAGCGSSSSGGSTTGTSGTGSAQGTAPVGTSSLKVATTPKFGTPSSSTAVQSGEAQVAYRNITINPDTLRVKVGTTIKWTNFDPVEHNVTSQSGPQHFASKNLKEGGTFEIKALAPGVIHYLCTIHPTSMNGTIEVVK